MEIILLTFTLNSQLVSTIGSGGRITSFVNKIICDRNIATLKGMTASYNQTFTKSKYRFDLYKHIKWETLKLQVSKIITFCFSSPTRKNCNCSVEDHVTAVKNIISFAYWTPIL